MSRSFLCDLCHDPVPNEEVGSIEISAEIESDNDDDLMDFDCKQFDLCRSCYREVIDLLHEKGLNDNPIEVSL